MGINPNGPPYVWPGARCYKAKLNHKMLHLECVCVRGGGGGGGGRGVNIQLSEEDCIQRRKQ